MDNAQPKTTTKSVEKISEQKEDLKVVSGKPEASPQKIESTITKIKRMLKVQIVGALGASILYTLNRSVRWKVHMYDQKDIKEWKIPEPMIMAVWHQRELMITFLYLRHIRSRIKKSMYTMISLHGDGRLIARAMRWFQIESVSGSSSNGGKKALSELIEKVQDGHGACMMPDGPKGPIFKAKYGVIKLAQQTGRPLVPVAYSADKVWQFGSWDKMMLPKPFSKGVYYIGEPLWIPSNTPDTELESYLVELEKRMTSALESADKLVA